MVAALAMLTMSLATAADGAVAVTVTPSLLASTVDDGAVAFGVLAATDTVSIIDAETAENTGNVNWGSLTAEYSTNPEASGCVWQAGAAGGSDIFAMEIDTDAAGTAGFTDPGLDIPADGGTTAALNAIPVVPGPGAALNLDFELEMPSIITTGATPCAIGITLTAS